MHELTLAAEAPSRRSAGGAFYTPRSMARAMLERSFEILEEASGGGARPVLVDPSCGAGAFLIAAARRLEAASPSSSRRRPAREHRLSMARSHIFGLDSDPRAARVARLALSLWVLEDDLADAAPRELVSVYEQLRGNIRVGDALLGDVLGGERFDLVIGNPPFVDAERMTRLSPEIRREIRERYRTARGNWDLFCPFIERALELCRLGGLVNLIVPNKVASAEYAAAARELLTRQNTLLGLLDLSREQIFEAQVYPLVFWARATPPGDTPPPIRVERASPHLGEGSRGISSYWIARDRLIRPPGNTWHAFSSSEAAGGLRRFERGCVPLERVAGIFGAATVAEAYAIKTVIRESGGEDDPTSKRLINSGTIDRFRSLWGRKRLRYLGSSFERPVVPGELLGELPRRRAGQAAAPKLIVAGMTRRLECFADRHGDYLAGKSTTVILPRRLDIFGLLAILNSAPIQQLYAARYGGNALKGGYLQIGPPQIRQLPIRLPEGPRLRAIWDELSDLGARRAALEEADPDDDRIHASDEAIDERVVDLYDS